MRYSHDWSFIARSLAHSAQDVNPITANGGARRAPGSAPGSAPGNAPGSAPEWRGAAVSAGIQKRDFAQTLARGLEVLQAFTVERPQATTTQIAAVAGISRAAARRILLTLRELGYVEEVAAHYWRLTPKVLRLGFAFFSSQSIWSVIAGDVRALAQEVNEPCAVAVLDGADILYVIRDSTRRIISTHVSPGERLPAYAASLGKVLLAALPEAELERYFEIAALERRTKKSITSKQALRRALARVRTDGYAIADEEMEDGLLSIAVPIRNSSGEVIAAINLSSHTSRMPLDELVSRMLPKLRQAAGRIDETVSMLESSGGPRRQS